MGWDAGVLDLVTGRKLRPGVQVRAAFGRYP